MTCLPITEFSCVRNWCQVSFLGIGRSVVHTSRDVAADNETLLHVGQFRNATQKMQHLISGLCACCRPSCWFQVQATHTFIRVALEIIRRISS